MTTSKTQKVAIAMRDIIPALVHGREHGITKGESFLYVRERFWNGEFWLVAADGAQVPAVLFALNKSMS